MSEFSIGDKECEEPDYRDVFFIEEDAVLQTASLDKLGDTNSGVPARLLGKHQFYLDIGATQYIIDSVESGYKLLFYEDQPCNASTFYMERCKQTILIVKLLILQDIPTMILTNSWM